MNVLFTTVKAGFNGMKKVRKALMAKVPMYHRAGLWNDCGVDFVAANVGFYVSSVPSIY